MLTCDQCGGAPTDHPLVKLFVQDWKALCSRQDTSRFLCKHCLLGKYAPVYRVPAQKWQMGKIVDYHSSDAFRFCFDFDGRLEWSTMDREPFDEYAKHCCRRNSSGAGGKISIFREQSDHRHQVSSKNTTERDSPDVNSGYSIEPLPWCQGKENQRFVYTTAREWNLSQHVRGNWKRNNSDMSVESADSRHRPRLWTIDEDKRLLDSVRKNQGLLKWSQIATRVPNRSGKQCRERYFNHLRPTVKSSEWNVVEDEILCSLYISLGSKWAAIARRLPGRTDNNVKNRFHNIRRRIIKNEELLTPLEDGKRRPNPNSMGEFQSLLQNTVNGWLKKTIPLPSIGQYCIFRLEQPNDRAICTRCSLLIPSKHTGPRVCQVTGWCTSCTQIPSYVSRDLLRVFIQSENVHAAKLSS